LIIKEGVHSHPAENPRTRSTKITEAARTAVGAAPKLRVTIASPDRRSCRKRLFTEVKKDNKKKPPPESKQLKQKREEKTSKKEQVSMTKAVGELRREDDARSQTPSKRTTLTHSESKPLRKGSDHLDSSSDALHIEESKGDLLGKTVEE